MVEPKPKKILGYIRRAEAAAGDSPDEQTKVGTLLVSRKTGSVVSEGYNGFARGANDAVLPKTSPEKHEYVIHAETNLICNAARNGVSTDDCFVVQTHSPCVHCARLLYQAGITVVYFKQYHKRTDEARRLGDLQLQYTPCDGYTKIEISPAN